MDHFDEIKLLAFLLILQASTHVNEVDFAPSEGQKSLFHVQVLEKVEIFLF